MASPAARSFAHLPRGWARRAPSRCVAHDARATSPTHGAAIAGLTATLVGAPTLARAEPPAAGARVALALETAVAAPTSERPARLALMPDAWLQIDERLALGLTTSSGARRRLVVERGLCLRGCDDTVGGAALEAAFALGDTGLRGRLALDARRVAPTALALEAGVDARRQVGRWTAAVEPRVAIGVARRDLANAEVAAVPFTFSVEPRPRITLAATAGARAQLTRGFFDSLQLMTYLSGAVASGIWSAAVRVGLDDALAAPRLPVVALTVGAAP
jgi:hypothetical protein